ncbi:hypothetical protein [Methylocella sp.]|jgi:hypothetical protein|uniref:hypothetical protein n=1 Tax=Methylocella sp. TaxID=1978226 RepID=UPI003C1F042D
MNVRSGDNVVKMPFKKKASADVLRERRETTQADMLKAQAALTQAQAAAHAVVRDGGNADALDRADAFVERARTRLATLSGGLRFIEEEIARIERGEVEEADRKLRTETAAAIEAKAARFAEILPAAMEAFRKVYEAAKDIEPLLGEIGMIDLHRRLIAETPDAFGTIAAELRGRAALVLSGQGSATLPQPFVAPVSTAAGPVGRVNVFLLKHIMYFDRELGHLRRERFSQIDMPQDIAAKAVDRGFAINPADERVKELAKQRVGNVPEPHACIDLDGDDLTPKPFQRLPAGPAVLSAGFDEIRKPSFALPVDAGRAS